MFLCLELWQKHQYLLTQTYLYQLCHVRFDAEIHINRVTFTIRFELEVKTRTSNRDWKYILLDGYFFISIWRVIFEDCKNWAPNWPRRIKYQLTYQEKTRGSTDDGQFKNLHEIFLTAILSGLRNCFFF